MKFLIRLFRLYSTSSTAGVPGEGLLKPPGSRVVFQVLKGEYPVPPWHPYRSGEFFKGEKGTVILGRMTEEEEETEEEDGERGEVIVDGEMDGSGVLAPGMMESSMMDSSRGNIVGGGGNGEGFPKARSVGLEEFVALWNLAHVVNGIGTREEVYRLGYGWEEGGREWKGVGDVGVKTIQVSRSEGVQRMETRNNYGRLELGIGKLHARGVTFVQDERTPLPNQQL